MKDRSQYIWAAAMSMALLVMPSTGAQQDGGACFLLDENGQQIDLGSLCGKGGSSSNGFKARIKRRQGGIPVIDVTFNGRHTVEMLLDTGASAIVIPASVAEQIDLRLDRVARFSTPSDSSVNFLIGRVDSISTAGVTARNIDVAVAPALDLGLLGQTFYGSYDIIIRRDVVEFRRR